MFNTSTSHLNNYFIQVDQKLVFIAVAALFSQGTNRQRKKIEEIHTFYRQSIDKC